MSYNVYHTDGALLTTVNDGSLNTVTSISLVGIGYANYSETISESFVHLMENFASAVSPLSPLVGQLWWDKTNGHLNVYDGTQFKSINPTTISATTPTDAVNGDFWFDTVNLQLKTYISPTWIAFAPIYTASQGISGPQVQTILDNYNAYHTITSLYNANNIVAVMSSDNSFTPFSLTGFYGNITPGITLGYGYEINGVTSYARNAYGLAANVDVYYMHTNANASTTGILSAPTILGAAIGNTGTNFTGSTINLTGDITTATAVYAANINATNIGYANTAYTGSTINISGGQITISNNLISAPTINAGTIGNSGAAFTGATLTTTGDITTSGNVVVATAPTNTSHAANKAYVDNKVYAAQLPVGTVIMWYGSIGSLPTGYQLCDGTNGTPDLRDRFVYGAGGNVALGVTGGNNYNTLSTTAAGGHLHTANTGIGGAHTHTITDSTSGYTLDITQIPAHRHVAPYSDNVDVGLPTVPGTYGSAGAGPTDYDQYKNYTGLSGGSGGDNLNVGGTTLPHAHNLSVTTSGVDGTHYHAFSTDTVAAHTHTVAFDNTPSWTALYYIMRIA